MSKTGLPNVYILGLKTATVHAGYDGGRKAHRWVLSNFANFYLNYKIGPWHHAIPKTIILN